MKILAWKLAETEPEKALFYLKNSIQPATPPSVVASIHRRIASIYNVLGNYEEAINEYKTVLEKFNISPEESIKAQILLANLYYNKGDYENALDNYNLALEKYSLSNDYIMLILSFMGYVYFEKGDSTRAMELWDEASRQKVVSKAMNSVANFFQGKMTVNDLLQDLESLPYIKGDDWLFIVGMRLEAEGKLAEAEKFYKKSLEIRKIEKDFPYLAVKRALERIEKKTQSIR